MTNLLRETTTQKFPLEVCERLAHYVYLYIDPRNGEVIYVGKGVGQRALAHVNRDDESPFTVRLKAMDEAGVKPRIDILRYGLTEDQAQLVEAAIIDLFDVKLLGNKIRGEGVEDGRITVDRLVAELRAEPIIITDRVILINIGRTFRHEMSDADLYEKTRQSWVMDRTGRRQRQADFVLSTFASIVREVYRPTRWYTVLPAPEGKKPRWAFEGVVADEGDRARYIGRSVSRLAKPGAQFPIKYVDVDPQQPTKQNLADASSGSA